VLILAVETSTAQVSCALTNYEGVLAAAQVRRGQRHAETLAPLIRHTCEVAGVTLAEVGALAVGVGPGLYTGLRVGIATAKAMAMALRIPVVAVSSLDLLAFPVRFTNRLIVTAMDARRGELFWATYRATPGGVQRLGPQAVASPEDVASELLASHDEILIVGDGALRYADHFAPLLRVEVADAGFAHPLASSLGQLAHARAVREEFVAAEEITPLYLRRPDAEANWIERTGPVHGDL
jgi:tRNA threonylcarbamoyladenosine biosynthesis protein TsaB